MPYKILCVEDQPLIWQNVKKVLTRAEYNQVFDFVDLFADTNLSAIDALKQSLPDIVLLDVRLRGDTPCHLFVQYVYKNYRNECPGAQVPFIIFYSAFWADVKVEMLELTMSLPTAHIDKTGDFGLLPRLIQEKICLCVLPFTAQKELQTIKFRENLQVAPPLVLWVHYESETRIIRARFIHNINTFTCSETFTEIARNLGAVNINEVNNGKRNQFVIIGRNMILNIAYLELDKYRSEIKLVGGDLPFPNGNLVITINADTFVALEKLMLWWVSRSGLDVKNLHP